MTGTCSATPARLLIAESNSERAEELRKTAESLGYTVRWVATPEEAVRVAVREEPQVVMLNFRASGLIGAREIASQIAQGLKIPVVFMSDSTDVGSGFFSSSENAGWLHIPAAADELRTVVEHALANRQPAESSEEPASPVE